LTNSDREKMEILEAFDLTRCAFSAGRLAGRGGPGLREWDKRIVTVYVDDLLVEATVGRLRSRWSHLFCDGDAGELHAFAARLWLRRSWFQHDPRAPGSTTTTSRPASESEPSRWGRRRFRSGRYEL